MIKPIIETCWHLDPHYRPPMKIVETCFIDTCVDAYSLNVSPVTDYQKSVSSLDSNIASILSTGSRKRRLPQPSYVTKEMEILQYKHASDRTFQNKKTFRIDWGSSFKDTLLI